MTKSEKIQYIKDHVSILEYAEVLNYHPKRRGRYFTLKEHDSVIIDVQKNKYYRNSRTGDETASGSIFDFVMHFQGYSNFEDAYNELVQYIGEATFEESVPRKPPKPKAPPKREVKFLILPNRAGIRKHVYAYLQYTRKIALEVINYFFDNGYLYEDVNRNCVFLGYDMTDTERTIPIFASLRGTNTYKTFKGDAEGNRYDYCFYINHENATELYVTESVIDTMSVMSLLPMKKRYKVSYQAIAGTQKWMAIFNYLMANPDIEVVYLGLDNDEGGLLTLQVIKQYAIENGFSQRFEDFIPICKDWNEELKERFKK